MFTHSFQDLFMFPNEYIHVRSCINAPFDPKEKEKHNFRES